MTVWDPAAARSLADDMCAGKAEIDASFDPLSNDDVQGTMLSDLDVDELVPPVAKALLSRLLFLMDLSIEPTLATLRQGGRAHQGQAGASTRPPATETPSPKTPPPISSVPDHRLTG